MPNNVTIVKGPGGLGRPLAGEDHISGYLHYSSVLPTGFTPSRIQQVFSIADAEALGITDAHLGEVSATSSLTITGAGSAGNTLALYVGSTNIGNYTVQTGDSTTNIAAGLLTDINAGSSGYTSATVSATQQVITVPSGLGVSANSYALNVVVSGTASATYSTVFSGGVASEIDIMHYHISEYFRIQPKGNLFLGCYATSADYAEITTMQNFAEGKIRQIGVYTSTTFTTSIPATIQTQLNLCNTNYKPLQCILQANFGVTSTSALSDLHTLTAPNVSVCVGQDGAAVGKTLYTASAKTIGMVGVTLGAVSLSKVNESIAWVAKYNMAATEMDTLAFAPNGVLYSSLSDGAIDAIDDKGYIFLKKHIGINGSYFDNPYTCVSTTSDYSRINLNRTIDKASRNLRTFILPQLARPINVNSDGTLSQDVISYFETLCQRALDQMVRDGELSTYGVIINPEQNILSTSELVLNVSLVPVGTADIITVNLGFVVSL